MLEQVARSAAEEAQGGAPLLKNPLEISAGHLPVPSGPGLGMELDWGQIEKQTATVIGG